MKYEKDIEDFYHGLSQGTMLPFAWRDWEVTETDSQDN